MSELLQRAQEIVRGHASLADLEISEEGGELQLFKGDERFARLIPTSREGLWRMEYCENRERWECIDFRGGLEECLAFLQENTHYHFWQG